MEYNLIRLIKKKQRRIQQEAPTPSQVEERSNEAVPSMSEFTTVKEDIMQIKEDIRRIEGIIQFTYNNTVDMPMLAEQVNILATSHATLFTLLQEMHDAKKGGRRSNTRYAKSYRPTSRAPPPTTPAPRSASLDIQQSKPVIEEVLEEITHTTAQLYDT